MHLAARDGVHFCFLAERAIFLDLDRDRYFAASPDSSKALRRAIDGTCFIGSDEHDILPLIEGDLLTLSEDPQRKLTPNTSSPSPDDWCDLPRPRLCSSANALLRQALVYRELRRKGLSAAVRARSKRTSLRKCRPPAPEILSGFNLTNLLFSADQQCKIKSLALHDALTRAGHPARLVLGVRDYPFLAHIWIELDGKVAGDFADHVATFQPILVI